MRIITKQVLSTFGAASIVIVLAACAPPSTAPEPAQTHVIRPQLETFRVTVPLSRATTAQPLPAQFVEEYYRRGRGPMTIVLPSAADNRATDAGQRMAGWLKERLIPASVGRAVSAEDVGDASVEVFFKAYVAVVPECGDWRGTAGHNPDNLPHTDFGCATQRNIGMMLSDPGELLGAPVTGAPDTPRMVDTMGRYRSGESIGAPPPATEQTTIQVER